MERGRPSKYDAAFPKQARKLCKLGATDQEIADFFGVHVATLFRWKDAHQDFRDALKEAKAEADARVEESLFQRAIGYSHEAVKIFMPAGAAEPVHAPYREKYPPDTTAAIFWLKNRQPERWRDVARHEMTGKDGGPIQTEDVSARDALISRIRGIAARNGEDERPPKLN